MKTKSWYCQQDIEFCIKCKKQCTNCASGYNEFNELKEESKHEDDE